MLHTAVRRRRPCCTNQLSLQLRQGITEITGQKDRCPHGLRSSLFQQRRNFSISQDQALNLLNSYGIPVKADLRQATDLWLTLSVNRSACQPQITMERATYDHPETLLSKAQVLYQYNQSPEELRYILGSVTRNLAVRKTLFVLMNLFKEKEASSFKVGMAKLRVGQFGVSQHGLDQYVVVSAAFNFDDAAFRSAKRQQNINSLRDTASEAPAEVEAEKHGVVYIR